MILILSLLKSVAQARIEKLGRTSSGVSTVIAARSSRP